MTADILAGFLTGIMSGWGVGGGTLLLIYLTSFAGMSQTAAQGINLIYFLPCSAAALVSHFRNGLIDMKAAVPAALAGAAATLISSLVATSIDSSCLRRLFGVFLLIVGVSELFRK